MSSKRVRLVDPYGPHRTLGSQLRPLMVIRDYPDMSWRFTNLTMSGFRPLPVCTGLSSWPQLSIRRRRKQGWGGTSSSCFETKWSDVRFGVDTQRMFKPAVIAVLYGRAAPQTRGRTSSRTRRNGRNYRNDAHGLQNRHRTHRTHRTQATRRRLNCATGPDEMRRGRKPPGRHPVSGRSSFSGCGAGHDVPPGVREDCRDGWAAGGLRGDAFGVVARHRRGRVRAPARALCGENPVRMHPSHAHLAVSVARI